MKKKQMIVDIHIGNENGLSYGYFKRTKITILVSLCLWCSYVVVKKDLSAKICTTSSKFCISLFSFAM